MPDKDGKFFAVRDLPERTRRAIKVFAAQHGLTMGQALERIIDSFVEEEAGTHDDEQLQPAPQAKRPPDDLDRFLQHVDAEARTQMMKLSAFGRQAMFEFLMLHIDGWIFMGASVGYTAQDKEQDDEEGSKIG